MSSGSSVFSIMPPKRARTERFILVQSPILAILRQRNVKAQTLVAPAWIAAIAATGNVLLYDTYVRAVSNPQNCSEYNSTPETLPQTRRAVMSPGFERRRRLLIAARRLEPATTLGTQQRLNPTLKALTTSSASWPTLSAFQCSSAV